ncbi:MAG: molybdopterin converting factor subunit 1 [Alphaproteobacteria bacterium]
MKLLYFAWLRTKIGTGAEEISPPEGVDDVGGLLDWLRRRGDGYAEALKDLTLVRVAVNHEYVGLDHPVRPSDEVALFPPVTGG